MDYSSNDSFLFHLHLNIFFNKSNEANIGRNSWYDTLLFRPILRIFSDCLFTSKLIDIATFCSIGKQACDYNFADVGDNTW